MFHKIKRHVKKLFSVYYIRRLGNPFDVVEFQRRYPENPFVTDDAYLTPLCQNVQFPFIQYIGRIKHVGLIMKVLYQLSVCVA